MDYAVILYEKGISENLKLLHFLKHSNNLILMCCIDDTLVKHEHFNIGNIYFTYCREKYGTHYYASYRNLPLSLKNKHSSKK